ncbi:hypothetical protein RB195_009300 [Necator americanus]|uniref:Uncharacterized protein n=1 Tax=Necator americanus TaxID=51031 RepID=A0ABR1CUL9_NECAM
MRLALIGLLLPLVLTADAPPILKQLQPEDHDLLIEGKHLPVRRIQARGVVQDEVADFPTQPGKTPSDDYSDFSNAPLKNGGANHQLKQVKYQPIPKKYEIPSPEPEADTSPGRSSVANQQPTRQTQLIVYQQPQPRKGYYYFHYPYNKLPRQYALNPRYGYIYPPQYQNTVYTYHHPLPYQDPYNIYRSDPVFNPYATAGAGCGGSSPCGGYAGGCGGSSGGCGGGCNGGSGSGGCGSGGGGCGGGDGCDYNDHEEDGEGSEESEEGGRSGEARINKKDPLEDLDLEDLEKLGKGESSEKSDSSRR